ncbi:MAG: hypothetical protein HY427_01535 [Candidatus Levybacteria bacterium]|nr:hypothetical protein [Candidatus Levybacteria bacterium]
MSKKRKTRHQKIMAATRRSVLENIIDTIETLPAAPLEQSEIIYPPNLKAYSYIYQEVQKTLLIITIIVALNIVLFLILRMKIISLFGIVF